MRVTPLCLALCLAACAAPPDDLVAAGVTVAEPSADPLLDRLHAIPGLTVVAELPVPPSYPAGTRFFSLELTQRANQLLPWSPTFQQRATLLVRDLAAPTVLYSTGYDLPIIPFRSEPTVLLGANQLAIEHRFFPPSRPEPPNWKHLTILQAAIDHHRFVEAFKPLLTGRWISTGGSKGGMTSVYHRRFFPRDVYATVAYVAPQDVIDSVDRYIEFIDNVGPDPACRDALERVQRESLEHRDELVPLMVERGAEQGYGFGRVLEADQAFEYMLLEFPFIFWQYGRAEYCSFLPPEGASIEELYEIVDGFIGFSYYSDEENEFYAPYYFQAATQINFPTVKTAHLAGLLRFLPQYHPANVVPHDIAVPRHDPLAMLDIDLWVRFAGQRIMFIYGENDPWSAEQFHLGPGSVDSFKYTVPAGNHGSRVALLPAEQRAEAQATIRRWGNVPAPAAKRAVTDDVDEESFLRARRRF